MPNMLRGMSFVAALSIGAAFAADPAPEDALTPEDGAAAPVAAEAAAAPEAPAPAEALAASSVLSLSEEDRARAKKAYARCSACHLDTGAGVPGAFPPLGDQIASFASTEAGRGYLAMALRKGVAGRIEVGGVPYMGAMPAQYPALDDAGIALMLNYILTEFADDSLEALAVEGFTAEEVASYAEQFPSASAATNPSLRAAALESLAGE
ncbi:MAG: cytochrome c [Pseudomonadota bacterium]